MDSVSQYLRATAGVIVGMPCDEIIHATDMLLRAWRDRRHVFLVGNGGSAATASHLANDLNKGTAAAGKWRFRAISLTDNVPLITAWGNDASYADVFVEQLSALMDAGDVLLAISASGNSPNVLRAVEYSTTHGGVTIGWTGQDGGRLRDAVDCCICVPTNDVGQIESAHTVLDHLFTDFLRAALVKEAHPAGLSNPGQTA